MDRLTKFKMKYTEKEKDLLLAMNNWQPLNIIWGSKEWQYIKDNRYCVYAQLIGESLE